MGLDATATAAAVAPHDEETPRRRKKIPAAPPFQIGKAVVVKEKGKRQWVGSARTLKYSSESGWWFEIVNEEGYTWSVHQSNVKEAKGRAKDTVQVRRRRQGRAGTSVATSVG
jgi:hypothetical protein